MSKPLLSGPALDWFIREISDIWARELSKKLETLDESDFEACQCVPGWDLSEPENLSDFLENEGVSLEHLLDPMSVPYFENVRLPV